MITSVTCHKCTLLNSMSHINRLSVGEHSEVSCSITAVYWSLKLVFMSDLLVYHNLLVSVSICCQFVLFYRASYASTVLAVIACPSVCPSVRPSVTSRSCTKMAKSRITLRTSYDSPGTLVFRCQKSWRNSNDFTLSLIHISEPTRPY